MQYDIYKYSYTQYMFIIATHSAELTNILLMLLTECQFLMNHYKCNKISKHTVESTLILLN